MLCAAFVWGFLGGCGVVVCRKGMIVVLDVTGVIEESDRILVDCSRLWDDVVVTMNAVLVSYGLVGRRVVIRPHNDVTEPLVACIDTSGLSDGEAEAVDSCVRDLLCSMAVYAGFVEQQYCESLESYSFTIK